MRTPLGTLILSCIVFVAFGILAASLGPVLPNLASNTASTLESTGTIFTAIFLGAFISQIGSGSLTDRIGPRPILIVGMILMSTGILGVSLSNSIILMLICGLIAGLGHGALDISVNTLIAKVFKDRSVAAVNLVNFFFGVGAIAGPALASLAIRQWNNGIPALWAGVALVILTIPFISIFMLSPVDKPIITAKSTGSPIYLSKLLWIAGLILFVYVGSETGMGGWTAAYMQQTSSIPADKAALIVSGFWMALTMGRLIAAFLGTRWTSNRLLSVSLAGASLGGLMLAFSTGNLVITIISVLMIGLFFGPIFPTIFSISTSLFSQSSGKAGGLIVAMASLGGMLLPPIQGVILTRFGTNSSVWMIAICTIAMLLLNVERNRVFHSQENPQDMAMNSSPVK